MTAVMEPDFIPGPLPELMESKTNFYFRMARVSRINPDGHPMLAPVAMQQGYNLVRNLLMQAGIRKTSLRSFHNRNKVVMATIGRNKAVVDLPGGIHFGGRQAWFIWMFVHLISIFSFRNKIVIISYRIWNYFTYVRGTRFIIRLFLAGNIANKKSH
jgi:NADH dehydrogenase